MIIEDKKIYVDMDGVIADFNTAFKKLNVDNLTPDEFIKTYSKNKFWNLLDKHADEFWINIPPMSDANVLMDFIYNNFIDIHILTASTRHPSSKIGKRMWIRRHFPFIREDNIIVVEEKKLKQKYATPNSILVDDNTQNISDWNNAGGIGILHKSANDTIKQLQQYV